MTEINYQELAEELYKSLEQCETPLTLHQERVMIKYKQLHKPKMTFTGYNNAKMYVYDNRDYALLNGFWYRCQNNILTYVEDGDLAEHLFIALIEFEKTQ
jgi:hypothetical protein